MDDDFLNKKECKTLINFYKSKPLPKEFYGTHPLNLDKNFNNKLLNKINNLSFNLNIIYYLILYVNKLCQNVILYLGVKPAI